MELLAAVLVFITVVEVIKTQLRAFNYAMLSFLLLLYVLVIVCFVFMLLFCRPEFPAFLLCFRASPALVVCAL